MSRAMLLGTSSSAIPIYESLKKYFDEVWVMGANERDPLSNIEKYVKADYSDPEQVNRHLEKTKFEALVPSCNDASFVTAATMAQKYGFPGYEPVRDLGPLTNKAKFRETLGQTIYNIPFKTLQKGHNVNPFWNSSPALLKPTRSHSGIGIVKIPKGKKSKSIKVNIECLVEEYIEGSLHSISTFFDNGEIMASFFVDEFCDTYSFAVSSSITPTSLESDIQDLATKMNVDIAKKMSINNGLIHTQFIFSKSGIFVLESMRRCPGDYYGSMIRKSSGFDYYGNYVLGYLNPKLKKKRIRSKLQQIQPIGRYSIYAQNEGRLEGMLIDLSNTKVEEMEIFTLTQSGTILEQKVSEKAAVMLIGFKSKEAMRNFNSNHLANKQLYAKCSL